MIPDRHHIAKPLFGSGHLFLNQEARTRSLLAGTRIMVAIELFQARHGRLPASLDELAPGVLPSVPDDPLTGKPFGYTLRNDGSGFLLYSLGIDGTDDGGTYPSRRGLGWTEAGWDVPINPGRVPREDEE
jgi:hypothetical protein